MTEVQVRVVEPMATNTTVENLSPGLKRKAEDDGKGKVIEVVDAHEKKQKVEAVVESALVELKGHKLVFKQDALPKDKAHKKRALEFSMFLLNAEEEGGATSEFPEDFLDLVVMTGHESNARTEALLIKQLKSSLKCTDSIPNTAFTPLIPRLFTQKEYGVLPSDFESASNVKVPVGLQIKVWEANEPEKFFAADQHPALVARRAEREKARGEVVKILGGLDDVEKLGLIKGEKGDKSEKANKEKAELQPKKEKVDKPKKAKKEEVAADKVDERERTPLLRAGSQVADATPRTAREGTANTVDSRPSPSPVKRSKMTPEEVRLDRPNWTKTDEQEEAARVKKEGKEARKAARAEKKAAEEREEDKKRAAVAKQAQTMSMFFKKPAPPSVSRASPAGPSTSPVTQVSPTKLSDYRRTFRAVQMRANVHWAPVSKWTRLQQEDKDISNWTTKDFLKDHLQKHKVNSKAKRRIPRGLKSAPMDKSVAELWAQYQDASDPRAVLDELQDPERFPWKTLAFDQQPRPPYRGTWTKRSVTVGPRTPFAQDPMFDYSYDSGDEWQDDEGGEDVDDFGGGEAEAEADDDEEDESEGEFDDWLDDSEDVGYGSIPAAADTDDDLPTSNGLEQARLPLKVVKKSAAPRKVVKLTPTWRGPLWEDCIGKGHDGMEGYRLQLLNETPLSIDPFTYVAEDPAQAFKTTFSSAVIGTNLDVKCLLSAEPIAVKSAAAAPTKPESRVNSTANASSTTTPSTAADASSATKGKQVGPKIGFPTTHLKELYQLIEGNTKIRSDLVSQLRSAFENVTSKAAIEAKIKEVAVRDGKAKDSQWRVKDEFWVAIGETPPIRGGLGAFVKAVPVPAFATAPAPAVAASSPSGEPAKPTPSVTASKEEPEQKVQLNSRRRLPGARSR